MVADAGGIECNGGAGRGVTPQLDADVNADVNIVPCTSVAQPGWLALRAALWPHCALDQHREEMARALGEPERFRQFIAYDAQDPVGLVEASIRSDYVNGTESSPVLFLEGIFVTPQARRRGVARALVDAVQAWGRASGCREFASDAGVDNVASHAMHAALGFEETERVVFFRKPLD